MMYRKLALLAASCLLSVSAFATTYDDAVDATFKNDADALAPLLAKGLDPNTVTSSGAGEPLLMLAIRKNANSVIDLLLKQKNIKVDQPNTLKETPLMIAIFLKDNDVAKKLIAHGAAVNNPKNWSPLHYAATSRQQGNGQVPDQQRRRCERKNASRHHSALHGSQRSRC